MSGTPVGAVVRGKLLIFHQTLKSFFGKRKGSSMQSEGSECPAEGSSDDECYPSAMTSR